MKSVIFWNGTNLIDKLIYVGNNSIADFLVEPSQCRIKWQVWEMQEHIVVEEFYCTVTKMQPTAIFFEHNAYTPAEISRLLLHDKSTGKLNSKVAQYRLKSATVTAKKTKKK